MFQGLFKPSVTFFTLSILQVIVLEVFAYWCMATYGSGWIPWTLSLLAMATVQVKRTLTKWHSKDVRMEKIYEPRGMIS